MGDSVRAYIPRARQISVGKSRPYVYEIVLAHQGKQWTIERRYSQFHALHKQIASRIEGPGYPSFPAKKIVKNKSPKFVQARRKALEEWLAALLEMQNVLSQAPALCDFLELGAQQHSMGTGLFISGDGPGGLGMSIGGNNGDGGGSVRRGSGIEWTDRRSSETAPLTLPSPLSSSPFRSSPLAIRKSATAAAASSTLPSATSATTTTTSAAAATTASVGLSAVVGGAGTPGNPFGVPDLDPSMSDSIVAGVQAAAIGTPQQLRKLSLTALHFGGGDGGGDGGGGGGGPDPFLTGGPAGGGEVSSSLLLGAQGGGGGGGSTEIDPFDAVFAAVVPTPERPLHCVAISDYIAAKSDELSFKCGESITVTGVDEASGWWIGVGAAATSSSSGLIPMNHVRQRDAPATLGTPGNPFEQATATAAPAMIP
eukprot:UC1_evm1s1828